MTTEAAGNGTAGWLGEAPVVCIVALGLVLMAIVPLGPPMVFSDEFAYAAWTSALYHGAPAPQGVAALNNWLYLRIYELVYAGSASFLTTARILNGVFAAVAAGTFVAVLRWGPAGESVASRQAERFIAASLAIGFAVVVPGAYAAYFMPEASYFAMAGLLVLALWRYGCNSGFANAACIGVFGGFAVMMKSHGMLLLPGSLLAVGLCDWHLSLGARRTLAHATVVAVSWLVCATFLGIAFGTHADLNPLGKFYTDMAANSATHAGELGMGLVAKIGFRHLATLGVIAAFPIALAGMLCWRLLRRQLDSQRAPLAVAAVMLVSSMFGMIIVTAVFSVGVLGTGAYEVIGRLHGRYYEHLAVMAACLGAFSASLLVRGWSGRMRVITAALLVAVVGVSVYVLRGVGWQNPNDYALAYAAFASPSGLNYAAAISLAAALAALCWPRHASASLCAGLLLWFAYDALGIDRLRFSIQPSAVDQAASMVADIESGADRSRVTVVAPEIDAYRIAFHLSEEDVTILPPGSNLACTKKERPEWFISVTPGAYPCAGSQILKIGNVGVSYVK